MGSTKAKRNLLHDYPVERDANGNYVCSWCTNGIETSLNKWMNHVYREHRPRWRRILNAQREKKRIQTQRRLDAENVLDDAIKEMDEDDDEGPTTVNIHSSISTAVNLRSSILTEEDKQIENVTTIEQLSEQFKAKKLGYLDYCKALASIIKQDFDINNLFS